MAELFPFRCDNCKQCLHFSTNFYPCYSDFFLYRDFKFKKVFRLIYSTILNFFPIGEYFPIGPTIGK